jgi:methyltransferase (TIGR00027 family)
MREDSPSVTAEGTLVFRAVEARKPTDHRICNDSIAHHFLTPRSTVIGRTWIPEPIARWFYNHGFPGLQGYIVGRTKYVDDHLQQCLETGLDQVVVLGAGYDSRAYRIEQLKTDTKVFEVDHPATQRAKQGKLEDIFGSLPEHVVYVPIDFMKESLADRLLAHGYEPASKTLFIWEGVTYYITSEAVNQTLDFVANHSGQGSSIIFDYTYPSVIEGTCPRREAKLWRKTVIPRGETLLFGIDEGTIETFLCQRGFQNVINVTHTSLRSDYFTGKNRRRKISPIFAIVHATI